MLRIFRTKTMDIVIRNPDVWTDKAQRGGPWLHVRPGGGRCSGFLRNVARHGWRVPPQMIHQGAAGPVSIDKILLLKLSVDCLALNFMRQWGCWVRSLPRRMVDLVSDHYCDCYDCRTITTFKDLCACLYVTFPGRSWRWSISSRCPGGRWSSGTTAT